MHKIYLKKATENLTKGNWGLLDPLQCPHVTISSKNVFSQSRFYFYNGVLGMSQVVVMLNRKT